MVRVTPLFGNVIEFPNLLTALDYFNSDAEPESSDSLVRVEVEVRYTNGDDVGGTFRTTRAAAEFLRLVAR